MPMPKSVLMSETIGSLSCPEPGRNRSASQTSCQSRLLVSPAVMQPPVTSSDANTSRSWMRPPRRGPLNSVDAFGGDQRSERRTCPVGSASDVRRSAEMDQVSGGWCAFISNRPITIDVFRLRAGPAPGGGRALGEGGNKRRRSCEGRHEGSIQTDTSGLRLCETSRNLVGSAGRLLRHQRARPPRPSAVICRRPRDDSGGLSRSESERTGTQYDPDSFFPR